MPDELPSGDKAVYIFLEMIALGFALEAVTSFMHGDIWWKWTGALALGVLFLLAGVKWLQIKMTIGQRLASSLERIASDRLYRRTIYSVIVIAFLVSFSFRVYRHYRHGLSNAASLPIQPLAQTLKTGPTAPSLGSQSIPVTIGSPAPTQLGVPSSKVMKPHAIPHAKVVPVPATQPEESAPQVRQPFDPNAMPEVLRPKPFVPDQVQSPSLARAETSDDILEEIRAVLEKDRELGELAGCPAGTSVDLRRVGKDVSYNLCVKQCLAAWKTVNPKSLDFSSVQVSQPHGEPNLAIIYIPCSQSSRFCVTDQEGTFTTTAVCRKRKVKDDLRDGLAIGVHAENVDSVVRLWKEFAQWKPTTK